MKSRFIVTVESDNLYAEVWVNNVPVGTVSPQESSPFSFPVNEYLVEGNNRVGIMLHSGPVPSRSGQPWNADPRAQSYKGPAKLSLRFAKYAPEEIPFQAHPPVLASIDWQGAAAPVPSYQERRVTIPQPFDALPWATATVFTSLDTKLRHDALDYLSHLYDLLAQHHFETYIDDSRFKMGFLARTYGIPLEPLLQQMLQFMQEASKPPFHMDAFNPATIDLRLAADGRLIDVNRINREPVFNYRKEGSQDTNSFFVKIGQKEGKWMMLA